MRLAIAAAALLAVAASPGGCGNGGNGYEPCAGKACGAACTVCPPGAPDCAETAVVKACDAAGRCVPASPELRCAPHPDCVGKVCGDGCNPCGPYRSCPTFVATACNRSGDCVAWTPGLWDCGCTGVACGASCRPPGCPWGAPCPAPLACDGSGGCVDPAGLVCR